MIIRKAMPLAPRVVLIDNFTIIGSAVCQKASPNKQQNTCKSTICIGCHTKAAINKNAMYIMPVNHPAS
jgi:hypothetical protein